MANKPSAIVTYEPGSTDYLYVPLTDDGQPAADAPSMIEFAFVPTGLEPDGDTVWYAAEPDDDGLNARLRIGSYQSGTQPGKGLFDLYVRITADPIRPVLPSGRVRIR